MTTRIQEQSRCPPRVISLEQKTCHHPGHSKRFRSSVSGTGSRSINLSLYLYMDINRYIWIYFYHLAVPHFPLIISLDLLPKGNPMGRSVMGREGFRYFWVPCLNYLQTMSSAVQAAIINYYRLGGLYNNLFHMVLEAEKSKTKVLEDLMKAFFLVCR